MSKATDLLYYMRLINENYTISSYLLEKFKFEPSELTQDIKLIQQEERQLGRINKIKNSSEQLDSKFYYEKYLKYKAKYMELKKLK